MITTNILLGKVFNLVSPTQSIVAFKIKLDIKFAFNEICNIFFNN